MSLFISVVISSDNTRMKYDGVNDESKRSITEYTKRTLSSKIVLTFEYDVVDVIDEHAHSL